MKAIFLGTVFTVFVLTSCSSQESRQRNLPQASQPSVTTPVSIVTPTPSPSPSKAQLTDAQKQERDKLAKELDRIDLELKEALEKNEEDHQKNKVCIAQEYNANFSPNDKDELSPECKKRLADLDKQSP